MASSARLADCAFARWGIARLASPADAARRSSLRLIAIWSCSSTKTLLSDSVAAFPGARSRPSTDSAADASFACAEPRSARRHVDHDTAAENLFGLGMVEVLLPGGNHDGGHAIADQ